MTAKIADLLNTWLSAQENVTRAKRVLTSAECALSNSINAIGKELMPSDAKGDEVFHVHALGGIIGIKRSGLPGAEWSVFWRVEPTERRA